MTLLDQLHALLAEEGVLPLNPNDALLGSALLEKVKPRLAGSYSENSIRQTFSVLAGDPTSPLARVEQGHGYYRRPSSPLPSPSAPSNAGATTSSERTATFPSEPTPRSDQLEEKFRAYYLRHVRLNSGFPMYVEHTAGARQPAGVNKWKFPDLVVLDWEVGEQQDDGFALDRTLLEVKRSLGDQPFKLSSVELKVELSLGNFRENFFQCVSNSKWAHVAHLVIATPISDSLLATELRRLGASYDVSVTHFNLTKERLEELPNAEAISELSDAAFENLTSDFTSTVIATGSPRGDLDWDHIRDMRTQSAEFRTLFDWIARCLRDARAYTSENFEALVRIESEPG